MRKYPSGAAQPGQGVAAAWRRGAFALAAWVLLRLVNRHDVHGSYYEADLRVRSWTRHGRLTRPLLAAHFAGEDVRDILGVHVTAPDETCCWVCVDIDAHGDEANPEANFRFARHVLREARRLGAVALLIDSNGAGGFHVWVLLPGPVPSVRAYRLARWLVRDHLAHGLAKVPEAFPKSVGLPGKKKCGGWVRVFGRHHKRDHWSRVWDARGRRWLDGDEAILATRPGEPDPTLLVPPDFDPAPRRPRPAGVPRPRKHRAASTEAHPSPRDVALARSALAHLGPDHRDDHDAWLRVGMALRQLGDEGLELWHAWSSASDKYDAGVLDAKWDGFDDDLQAPGRITLGSLFHAAKLAGWAGPPEGRRACRRRATSRITIHINLLDEDDE